MLMEYWWTGIGRGNPNSGRKKNKVPPSSPQMPHV